MNEHPDAAAVTRWEWRTFEQTLPVDARLLESARAGATEVSDEIYLLSSLPDFNVKIRHGEIDIKHLEEVNTAGLERWRPILKQPFPIDASAVYQVCQALDIPLPAHPRDQYDQRMLLRDVVGRDARRLVIPLIKLRSRITVLHCRGEIVVLRLREERWESLSFEDGDQARVLAAVRHLGLDPHANTNYPSGLRRILGLTNGHPLASHGVA